MAVLVSHRFFARLRRRPARSSLAAPLAALTALTVICAGGTAAWAQGWRVNLTPSLPGLLYRVVPVAEAQPGDYVEFCRPLPIGHVPDGPCPDGTARLLKRVIAVAGDRVLFTPDDIAVYRGGQEPIVYRAPWQVRDSKGKPLPHPTWGAEILVTPGHVVVIGDHLMSLDSRYFGLVKGE